MFYFGGHLGNEQVKLQEYFVNDYPVKRKYIYCFGAQRRFHVPHWGVNPFQN